MKLVKKTGIFYPEGEIILHPGTSVSWKIFSNKKVPELPPGTPLEIDIYLDEQTLLSGDYGIVWATYDLRQGEVLYNALLAQNIASVLGKIELDEGNLWLIIIESEKDIREAMDYIWRREDGLRLQPDWSYAKGKPNKSFEKWLNG